MRDSLALTSRQDVISFAGGLPAPELFDVEGISSAYERVLRESSARVLQYSVTDGDPALREAIALFLARAELPTVADDLLVTTGAQQAIYVLSATLLEPADIVLVENPTYVAALQVFSAVRARVIPVPTDSDGMVIEALRELVVEYRPRMLYLVPTFQNPTGHTLPADRRAAVSRIAAEYGVWIVEDDPYGELRFRGERLPLIASYAESADRTILLGSMSKLLAPGMRLGWMRAPATVRAACAVVKQAVDLHSSTIDQAAAAAYLAASDLDGRIARARALYSERCDALVDALSRALPHGSSWSRPNGGMFVWVRLPDGFDTTALLSAALAQRVAYVPGAPFFAGVADSSTLRMSFSAHNPAEIREGVERLAAVLDGSQRDRCSR
ncbi:PLP-dependent aminotransferase family protein [Nocardia beijingensis]|uniref:aminotransferase-like domain-containing protein n=1 Tax=Nocardia beijingensis TaxID=95162 RepID=UPI002B4AEE15|nr:PLP-dependent aminotransferase family protein [Nocardia beijingensis]